MINISKVAFLNLDNYKCMVNGTGKDCVGKVAASYKLFNIVSHLP